MPPDKELKIKRLARALKARALSNRRLLPARAVAQFTGLCQSVYLAVSSARLYLRALHDAMATKLRWNSNIRL